MDLQTLMAYARALGLDPGIEPTQYGNTVTAWTQAETREICRVSLSQPWQARAWEVTWSLPQTVRVLDAPTIDVTPPAGPTGRALVRWGIGGAAHEVECDLFPGGTLTVTGQQVSVGAFHPGIDGGISVSATIAPAPGKRRAPVYRSIDLGDIPPSGNAFVRVPRFARRFALVIDDDNASAAWEVELRELIPPTTVTLIGLYTIAHSSIRVQFGTFVPLLNRCNELRVVSGDTVDPRHATIIFELEV